MFKVFISLIVGLTFLCNCTKKSDSTVNQTDEKNSSSIIVGLVLDKGGKDDKSFNTAAFQGAQRAVQELKIQLKDVESPDDAAFEPSIRAMAERKCSLIIGIGFAQKDAIAKVASQSPNVHFAIVDAEIQASNVKSLMFQEHEGSYLIGYLAGLFTKTGSVGFIGGMDIALIRRFEMGYEAGFKAVKKDGKLITNFVGITSDAWANPNRAKELALSQYGRNVDIIYVAAGASNMGAFDAAEEKKLYAIGVDSNQNWIKPGRIITSMLKRVDNAVFDVIKSEVDKSFQPGIKYFGLADKGIDYAVDQHNQSLIAPHQKKLEEIKQDIISGKIKVPDFYEIQKTNK